MNIYRRARRTSPAATVPLTFPSPERRKGSPLQLTTYVLLSVLFSFTLVAPAHAHSLTAGRAATSPIYIGQIVPLTGVYAPFPNGSRRYQLAAARLAVRQINAQGGINGRPLKLVLVDDRSTSAGAISAMQKLAGLHHITAIIGPNLSQEIVDMMPAIKQAGIPMIIGGQAPITTHSGNRWVFRCRPNQIIESRVITTFAVSTLHLTRIAVIHTNDVAGTGSEALLLGNLKRLGVVPVANETIPINSSDLTAQVLAIKKSGARALIVTLAQVSDYLLLARQMHQVGLHLTWVGNPILSVGTTVRQGGALLYGTYSATDSAPDQSPEAIAYNKELARQFHLTEPSSNAYVYDGLQILARVMRSVGTSPQAIRRGILALRGFRGVEGIYRFDRNGDGVHQEAIVQNVRGRLRVIKVVTV